jgi:DNA ligase-1
MIASVKLPNGSWSREGIEIPKTFLAGEMDTFLARVEALKERELAAREAGKEEAEVIPMQPKMFVASKAVYPCCVQPKLDGVRAVWQRGLFRSRNGLQFHVPHVNMPEVGEILDGELYVEGCSVTDIAGAVRNGDNAVAGKLKFYMFDIVCEGSFEERYQKLCRLRNKLRRRGVELELVPTYKVKSEAELKRKFEEFLAEGYEGLIYRDGGAVYEGGYTDAVMKLKKKESAEYTIEDIEECKTKTVLTLLTSAGREFRCTAAGSKEICRGYVERRRELLGKPATVEYYQLTAAGVPMHGNVVAVRDYE